MGEGEPATGGVRDVLLSPLEAALVQLNSGCCLWVGAGVALHLARGLGGATPLWGELVSRMEAAAGAPKAPDGATFPERLEVVKRHIGVVRFQRSIREHVHDPLARAILDAQTVERIDVPEAFRDLASLGALANPVVNFNLESYTSQALCAGENYAILPFRLSSAGLPPDGAYTGASARPRRLIYQPHGSITSSGICALAADGYRQLEDTLGLRLAVHASFRQHLAIVGMSLADDYLREQLAEFRCQLNRIFWFTSEPGHHEHWAWKNDVIVVPCAWDDFWSALRRSTPRPNEFALRQSWARAVESAAMHLDSPTVRQVAKFRRLFPGDDRSTEVEWLLSAVDRGEVVSEAALASGGRPRGPFLQCLAAFYQETGRHLEAEREKD